jgi:hypothetical protein
LQKIIKITQIMTFGRVTITHLALVVAVVLQSSVYANSTLHKCCQLNEVYDIVDRVCVKKSANENKLNASEHLFDSNSKIGSPKCDGDDDVAVEYDSEKHNITFYGGHLLLPSHAKSNALVEAQPNSFCIDSVSGDGMNVAKKSHWMAKTCRPRSVCDNIPCVRKCCGDGEKMQRQNSTLDCVEHKDGIKPIFHNFSATGIIRADAKCK